jgi:hypothetical protein
MLQLRRLQRLWINLRWSDDRRRPCVNQMSQTGHVANGRQCDGAHVAARDAAESLRSPYLLLWIEPLFRTATGEIICLP